MILTGVSENHLADMTLCWFDQGKSAPAIELASDEIRRVSLPDHPSAHQSGSLWEMSHVRSLLVLAPT